MTTPRHRFKETICFRKSDALPWVENFWDETVLGWFGQGLPAESVATVEWEIGRSGTVLQNMPTLKGFNPNSYFGCQRLFGCLLPLDTGPIPRYKLRLLNETDRYQEFLTETGATARRSKTGRYAWYNMPMFLDFPVKDRRTWNEYVKRLDPKDPRRYPKDWDPDAYAHAFETYQEGPTVVRFNGFYAFGAELMGIPTFNVTFYKDPELMHDMIEHWEYLAVETTRNAVEALTDRIDIAFWWEDMADRHGPCVSPKIFKEFFLPHYKRITSFLSKNKIVKILMDSDGNMNPILDLILESGINGIWPLEVNAGMDAVALRKKYGNNLFLAGNLDKAELMKGGQAMKNEIDSKVPILKETSGYIPGADHVIPVEMTLERFNEYSDYIKKLLPY